MPLYLIDTIGETGQGPFTEKSEVAEAYDEETQVDAFVVEIDENGAITSVRSTTDYFEDESEE